jgi:hypothetical protein
VGQEHEDKVDGWRVVPRFLTDAELRVVFGLTERALARLRASTGFPRKDALIGKTDRRAVEAFFDRRAGIITQADPLLSVDGEEDFSGL